MQTKIVAYTRALAGGKTSQGHEIQLKEIVQFCKKQNFHIVKIFAEECMDVDEDITERPTIIEMIEFCKENDVRNVVVVDETYRFSRALLQQLLIEKTLLDNNVKIVSVQDGCSNNGIFMNVLRDMVNVFSSINKKIESENSKEEKLDYGPIREYADSELWYEPITDELDGFVLRSKQGQGHIISVYSQDTR